jgi:hypothetical protein
VNAVRDTDAAVKTREICAAAEEHMLAIIDDLFHSRMQIGTGTTAQVAAALDELHAQAGFGQGAGRAHAGYAATDNRDSLSGILPQSGQFLLHPPRAVLSQIAINLNLH